MDFGRFGGALGAEEARRPAAAALQHLQGPAGEFWEFQEFGDFFENSGIFWNFWEHDSLPGVPAVLGQRWNLCRWEFGADFGVLGLFRGCF